MILAVDAGNTHVVIGTMDISNEIHQIFRIPTDRLDTDYGYAIKIKEILDFSNIPTDSFEGAVISSVVPSLIDTLKQAVKLITGIDALVVGSGIKTGIKIAIDDPGTIAADLVATAVAAKENYPLPCAIIDMGTATTITIVDKDGVYRGGAILTGPGTSLRALVSATSLLPNIEIKAPKKVLATNTVDSMQCGLIYGTAGSVDGILERFEEENGGPFASIVTTGGLGGVICKYCKHEVIIDENLLLKGLGTIWKKNCK